MTFPVWVVLRLFFSAEFAEGGDWEKEDEEGYAEGDIKSAGIRERRMGLWMIVEFIYIVARMSRCCRKLTSKFP